MNRSRYNWGVSHLLLQSWFLGMSRDCLFWNVRFPSCRQVLIILKLYAGGPHDLLDVHQILKVRRPQAKDAARHHIDGGGSGSIERVGERV